MNFRTRAFSLEDEGKLRKLTYLRMVVATIVVGAAILILRLDNKLLSAVALYSLLGLLYLSTGSCYLAFRTGVPLKSLLWILICSDVAVLTMIVHFSGGSASYFTILYILPILVGGLNFGIIGGLSTAVIAASAYTAYSLLELGGFVQDPSGYWPGSSQSVYRTLVRVYLNIAVFVFTGLLSGYISRHIRSKGQALADREREIRRIQLNTDNIIKNMSSGLIVTSMSGEIISMNPAAISILGLEDGTVPEGRVIKDAILHMPALYKELSQALEKETPLKRHELEVVKTDGSVLPLGISISILKGEGEEKRGVIALFQDLTEVHRMREKVRRADKMAAIGELSAAIAHEIRAPLASICGSIEMLSEGLEPVGDNVELMNLILRESDRLDGIITDFLEFARPRIPELAPVDIGRCLGEVVMLLRNSSELRHVVSIRVVNEAGEARLNADEEMVRQVFLNLGLNACEATGEGGRVEAVVRRVSAQFKDGEEPRDCISVDFENYGQSIPQDVIQHVFEPFFTTKEGGTGLGLAIAQRIVESHSGLIRAESLEGKTVFSVLFPVGVGSGKEHEEEFQEEFISF